MASSIGGAGGSGSIQGSGDNGEDKKTKKKVRFDIPGGGDHEVSSTEDSPKSGATSSKVRALQEKLNALPGPFQGTVKPGELKMGPDSGKPPVPLKSILKKPQVQTEEKVVSDQEKPKTKPISEGIKQRVQKLVSQPGPFQSQSTSVKKSETLAEQVASGSESRTESADVSVQSKLNAAAKDVKNKVGSAMEQAKSRVGDLIDRARTTRKDITKEGTEGVDETQSAASTSVSAALRERVQRTAGNVKTKLRSLKEMGRSSKPLKGETKSGRKAALALWKRIQEKFATVKKLAGVLRERIKQHFSSTEGRRLADEFDDIANGRVEDPSLKDENQETSETGAEGGIYETSKTSEAPYSGIYEVPRGGRRPLSEPLNPEDTGIYSIPRGSAGLEGISTIYELIGVPDSGSHDGGETVHSVPEEVLSTLDDIQVEMENLYEDMSGNSSDGIYEDMTKLGK